MLGRAVCASIGLAVCAGIASAAGAGVELNTATLAQLEAMGGIGTALAARIVEERTQRPFANWSDAQRRLKGLGPAVAARLSEQGLTVNGAPYAAPPRPSAAPASSPR